MATEMEVLEGKIGKVEEFLPVLKEVLTEVKAALDSALANGDTQRLKVASDRVGNILNVLVEAAKAADVTPETPVNHPEGTQEPVDETQPPVDETQPQ